MTRIIKGTSKVSNDKILCYIGGGVVSIDGSTMTTTAFFGKIVNGLASSFKSVILVVPVVSRSEAHDFTLASNVVVKNVPAGGSAVGNVKVSHRWRPVLSAAISHSDYVFIRGLFTPALGYIYYSCRHQNKPLLHWLIGNPKALLETHRRNGFVKDSLGKVYTRFWCAYLDCLHNYGKGLAGYICNGSEIYECFSKKKSWTVVSSTLTEEDYFLREDVCKLEPIIIGTLCYLRPENGVEYLLGAIDLLRDGAIELHLYGGFGKYKSYEAQLLKLVNELDLRERVKFMGQVRSVDVPSVMRKLDIFVLPTLSEGTPRVILEAQANCAPVIASKVGGIPDMITNGVSGVLVAPKSSKDLAMAISNMISNSRARREIIRNGYESAKMNDLTSLVSSIVEKYRFLGRES